jgi:hypothetical protein
MFSLRWSPCWRAWPRRLCAAVTLLAYLAAALGVPLPAAAPPKDRGEPFPCQDHPCGCRTAEQCWRGCCCFTPAQRWAWAREHNVTPPPYAEKPAAKSWRSTRRRYRAAGKAEPKATCSCCTTRTSPERRPTGQAPSRSPRKPCCSTAPRQDTCRHTPKQKKPTRDSRPGGQRGPAWHLGVAALDCQGQANHWATAGTVLPARPPLRWAPHLVPVGWLAQAEPVPAALPLTPPDPPPRSGLVTPSV